MDDAVFVRVTLERRWPIGTRVRICASVATNMEDGRDGVVVEYDAHPQAEWDHRVGFPNGGIGHYAFDELELIDG